MHTSLFHPFTARLSQTRTVHANLQIIVHISNIITRLPLRAAHNRNGLPPLIQPPRKIRKHHITHKHIRSPSRSPIIATVLRDNAPILSPTDIKVREQQIPHIPPPTAARQVIGLVITIAAGHKLAYPRLDVNGISDVVLSAAFDYRGIVDLDVAHARVFEELAERAYGDSVAADAGHVVDGDVVAAGFDGDAVIAALVEEVCEVDVAAIHSVCEINQ